VHLPLTPERLAACYEALRSFPPFCHWHLPPAAEATFRVIRSKSKYGDYSGPPHMIRISSSNIGQVSSLLPVLAHEMIHLRERVKGRRRWDAHGAEFVKLARSVCKLHGWDPQLFV